MHHALRSHTTPLVTMLRRSPAARRAHVMLVSSCVRRRECGCHGERRRREKERGTEPRESDPRRKKSNKNDFAKPGKPPRLPLLPPLFRAAGEGISREWYSPRRWMAQTWLRRRLHTPSGVGRTPPSLEWARGQTRMCCTFRRATTTPPQVLLYDRASYL